MDFHFAINLKVDLLCTPGALGECEPQFQSVACGVIPEWGSETLQKREKMSRYPFLLPPFSLVVTV